MIMEVNDYWVWWNMVGPGLSRILTDVPTGPVPLSVDLRSLASLATGVVGTVKVIVAPDALFGQVLSHLFAPVDL